jgi:hypothetical protein
MKYKEQKQLELLYEQIASNKTTLELLPEEEKYFKNVIDFYFNRFNTNPRIREFMKKGSSSAVLVTMLNGYERPAPFSQFCVDSLGSKEKVINSFYNTNVLGFTESFIRLKKVKTNDGKKVLAFQFLKLNNSNSNPKTIPLMETQIVRENIEKSLMNALEHFINRAHTIKAEDKYVTMWYEWRDDRVKYQKLRDKLPELEGVF